MSLMFSIPISVDTNAGIPMLFIVMPVFGIALLPIIAIEAYYLSRSLRLTGWWVAGKTAIISNVVSTIIGIPLTWLLLLIVQMCTISGKAYGIDTTLGWIQSVILQSPWLLPYEESLHWMIPIAEMVLFIPFFFASWWVEYRVSKKLLAEIEVHQLKRVVRNANLITYGMLGLYLLVRLIMAVSTA